MKNLIEDYVSFFLAGKEYAVNIEQVNEVIRMREIVPVPDTAHYVEGIINIRERIIPVINMRKKLGLEVRDADRKTCIIISQISQGKYIALLIDQIGDLIQLSDEQVDPLDESLKDKEYLYGVARLENRLVLVIDFVKFLTTNERETISNVVGEKVEVRGRKE